MTEKPQETEGIIKGGKREPVAEDDQFPPEGAESGAQDSEAEGVEVEENPRGPRPL
jgi:hypothetical protein